MAKFRVKLDMSSFYTDQRNTAYVLINSTWEYVHCLITHIENIFKIENIQLLTEDSCFLSPLESIEIIKENEVLKPVYLEIENGKKTIETQLDDQSVYCNATQMLKKKKSKKNANLISATVEKENSTSFEEQQNKTKVVSSSENEYDDLDCTQSSTNTKRKRKRKRKRPNTSSETIQSDGVDVLKIKACGQENLFIGSSKIPTKFGHIHFDNCGNDVIKKTNSNNVVWKNALDLLNSMPRLREGIIVETVKANNFQLLQTDTALSIENKHISPLHVPVHDEIVANFQENSAIDDVKDCIESKPKNITQKELAIKISDILPNMEPLKGEFQYGDLVLFKMMCENGQLTDFVCGKFIEIISIEDNVGKLILVDGHAEIRNKIIGSKFSRIPENSTCRFSKWANEISHEKLEYEIYTSNGPTVIMPTWFCHRNVVEKVGRFCENGRGTPEDLIFFYKHLDNGGRVIRIDEVLVMYRYHPEATTFSISKETIWNLRHNRFINRVLIKEPWTNGFTIWNAGKQGRRFFRHIPEYLKSKVKAFCDVDKYKISKCYNFYDETKRRITYSIPIIHFTKAEAPILICMKLGLTNGGFERNLSSLNLVENEDYILFS